METEGEREREGERDRPILVTKKWQIGGEGEERKEEALKEYSKLIWIF